VALREGIPQLIEAAVRNDTAAMIAALNAMGFLTNNRDAEKMAEKMLNALRNFLQNEVELEGLNFKDIKVDPFNNSLFSLVQEIGLNGVAGTVQVPKDYVLLSRMITLLLGLCNALDPTLNPLDVVRPYAQQYMLKNEGVFSFVNGILRRAATTTLGLPDELNQVLQRIKKGELEVNNPDVKQAARLLYSVGQQLVWALLLITAVVLSFLFYKEGEKETMRIGLWISGLLGILLFRAQRKGKKYLL
jgi:ubiquinone biosynthesis protein